MTRIVLFTLIVLAILLLATAFAALNQGTITLDVAFFQTEMQKSLALTIAFGFGWVFGLFCAVFALIRLSGERRRLRKALSLAEAEVKTLRNMPFQDAD